MSILQITLSMIEITNFARNIYQLQHSEIVDNQLIFDFTLQRVEQLKKQIIFMFLRKYREGINTRKTKLFNTIKTNPLTSSETLKYYLLCD